MNKRHVNSSYLTIKETAITELLQSGKVCMARMKLKCPYLDPVWICVQSH
jgi:hypothetical protein